MKVRLKHLSTINRKKLDWRQEPDREISYVDLAGLDYESGSFTAQVMRLAEAPSRARRLANPGDVLVPSLVGTKSWMNGAATVIDWVSAEYVFSTGFFTISGNPYVDARYIAYLLKSKQVLSSLRLAARGVTLVAFTPSNLGDIIVPITDPRLQSMIADFLDRETEWIDQLVEKKRRLVELLEEKRKAVLTRVLLNGIGGELRHLDRRPLRAVAEVLVGRQRSPRHAVGPNMIQYLRAANVKDRRLDLEDVKTMNFDTDEQRTFRLLRGDVLVTEGAGSLRAVGASAVWEEQIPGIVCYQNTLLRFRPSSGVHQRFLGWWAAFAFASRLFASVASGVNILHLSAERVRNLPVRLPSSREQLLIADYLDGIDSKLDGAAHLIDKQVLRLTEYRQALITSAVTGQLDINGEIPDPEEVVT